MTERWKEKLGAFDRAEPDEGTLRGLSSQGPRMPEPGRSSGSRVLAGVVAVAVAAGALAFLVSAFRDEPSDQAASDLDPAAICDVPAYDPDVALLIGQPVREVPLADLQVPGAPASELEGRATDALRAYLASPAAIHAPTDGWREVEVEWEEAVFVAPWDDAEGWWIAGFTEQPDGDWRMSSEEIVDQTSTPAQRGHDLRLEWNGALTLDGGAWNDPLRLVNDRDEIWTDEGRLHWGIPHVFDRATGTEIPSPLPSAGWSGEPYEVPAGGTLDLPVALGGVLSALQPGTYDVVACVPDLGMASPVGTLEVGANGVVPNVRVLTYPSEGGGMMEALGGGTLEVVDDCLAATYGPQHGQFVVWPHGHVVVERSSRQVLIDPVGTEVAELGDDVTLGGGHVPERWMHDLGVDVPEACAASGRGYFVTSGLADAG